MKVIKEDFALLKDNLDIVDVISSYGIELKRTGTTHTALCPFHQEKTPSFKVWPKSGNYECQGCKEKGDIISFVQAKEGLKTASEAAISLSKRFDIPIRFEEKGVQEKTTEDIANEIILANEFALKSFQQQFKDSYHARAYMAKERGYTKEIVEKWEIGYASYDYKLDYDQESLKKAGLLEEKNGKITNKFRGRIMFPIRDRTGRLVGFGGRTIEESPNTPKYLNTEETIVFKKGTMLYGQFQAQKAIKRYGFATLVEGYTDVNLMDLAFIINTVGICGTSFTDEQAKLICSHGGDFNMYFIDNDIAGRKSAAAAIVKHWQNNMMCKVVVSKIDKWDPAKMAVEYKDATQENIEELSQVQILYDHAKSETKEGKTDEVLALIAILPSSLKRHDMIEELSEVSGYPVKILSEAINKHIQKAVFYNGK